MGAAGGRWAEARDSAARWGEVRHFGDARSSPDSTPTRGRSLLAPALLAASASDRPLIVVTDGEIEDVREVPPDLLARSGIRLFPRAARPDLAITRVTGPSRVSEGDSVPLEVEVQPTGGNAADSVRVEVLSGTRRLAFRTVRLRGEVGGPGPDRRPVRLALLRRPPAASCSRRRRRCRASHRCPAASGHRCTHSGGRAPGGARGLGQPVSLSDPARGWAAPDPGVCPSGRRPLALDGRSPPGSGRRRCGGRRDGPIC